MANINTYSYWDDRYKNNWSQRGGEQQSAAFATAVVKELPQDIKDKINGFNIIDTSCAFGNSLPVLQTTFPNSKLSGSDFVDEAIVQAKKRFPQFDFIKEITDKYDVLYSSNSLEHMDNWMDMLSNYLKKCNKYMIILVPLNEDIPEGSYGEHIVSFNFNSFPDKFNGFKKIFQKEIKTEWWMWTQLLLVYENFK